MGNSSTSHLPSYVNCIYGNLSRDSITSEYWDTANINLDFKIASLVMATILLLYLIIGVTSNAILIVFIISKHLKEPTYILLLNLAISDILVCGLFMPFGIVAGYAGGFVFGSSDKVRCQVCQFGLVYTTLSVASLNILGLISIDRFVFFKYPLRYRRYITTTKTVFIVILVWLFSVVQSILPLFGFGEIRYTYSICFCQVYLYGKTSVTKNIYYLIMLVLLGLIPMITIIVTNACIINIVRVQIKKLYRIRKSFGNRSELRNHQQSLRRVITKTKNKKQIALFRAFGIIFIANVITWVPLLLITFATFTIGADSMPIGIYMFVYLTFISHSVLHPIIEGCLIPELKTSLKRILCPCKKRNIATISIVAEDDNGRWSTCRSYLDICSFALLFWSRDVMDINADTSFTGAKQLNTVATID